MTEHVIVTVHSPESTQEIVSSMKRFLEKVGLSSESHCLSASVVGTYRSPKSNEHQWRTNNRTSFVVPPSVANALQRECPVSERDEETGKYPENPTRNAFREEFGFTVTFPPFPSRCVYASSVTRTNYLTGENYSQALVPQLQLSLPPEDSDDIYTSRAIRNKIVSEYTGPGNNLLVRTRKALGLSKSSITPKISRTAAGIPLGKFVEINFSDDVPEATRNAACFLLNGQPIYMEDGDYQWIEVARVSYAPAVQNKSGKFRR